MSYCDGWCTTQADQKYHDTEWGFPVHNDRKLFEFLMLEVLQCGLSWQLMIKKRAIFRTCFDQFNYTKIAAYGAQDIQRILNTPGMIRSERKIKAIIQNAQAFLRVRKDFGSFNKFLWSYSEGKSIIYAGHARGAVPTANGLSTQISRELKARGFTFLGPVTIYSYLQSCGVINDHDFTCPLFKKISQQYSCITKKRDQEVF